MKHLDIVTAEELVPESGDGDNKYTGLLERGDEPWEEDGETREDETVEGEADMADEERRQDVVQLEAEDKNPEDVVTGVTGVFK